MKEKREWNNGELISNHRTFTLQIASHEFLNLRLLPGELTPKEVFYAGTHASTSLLLH
jgi:hypothetical protein